MQTQKIQLSVNGKAIEKEVDSRKNLADFLREDLALTGTHVGCEHGVCGSCTILYNGQPIRSCLLLAVQADQSEVVTVEGLLEDGKLGPLQTAFKKHHALQCGFCTPGFLTTASALLRGNRNLSELDIRKAIAGNLCRCTGYQNIVNAIVEASGGKVSPDSFSAETHTARQGLIGSRMQRVEDDELLSGRGVFVDDLAFPGMLHAFVVRSIHAQARIQRIDARAAKATAGVAGVFTSEDLGNTPRFPQDIPHPNLKPLTEFPLARDKVRYVGEPVAVVVASSRSLAEDAAALIDIEYEALPACLDIEKALQTDAPLVHETEENNLAGFMEQEAGDVDRAFDQADHVVKEVLRIHRGGCHAIETRGIIAQYEPKEGSLAVWATTQGAHRVRRTLLALLDLPEHKVRIIAPRIGGGFGPKGGFYPENFLIPWLAIRLGTPVKWIEDRREHFISTRQERDQTHWVEAAFNKDGKIQALKVFFLHDAGAYTTSIIVPWITLATIPGPYKIPNLRLSFKAVFTNKVPAMVVRGAGRPQAVFVMEKVVERIARDLNLDPAEVRMRNFVEEKDFPYSVGILYRDNNPLVYDSGNYVECLRKALEAADYRSFRASQLSARKNGMRSGVGIAAYVEGTGFGPYEGATVRVSGNGKVYVFTGAVSQGQGQETALAQVCADYLGADFKDIHVTTGDSAMIQYGIGTFASRVMVTAGNAVAQAATRVREKIVRIASSILECNSDDLLIEAGEISVKGSPEKRISLRRVAAEATAIIFGFSSGENVEPGLEATVYFSPKRATHSNGVHVAFVEVDEETGAVEIKRYVVVHDCGRILNPMIVDGQIHGGVAHGIGNALYEEVIHDESGQVLNTSFMDYLIPGSTEVPKMEVHHMETPTPLNPLGCKGAGEGGTIPSAAAVAFAIEDALSDLGVKVNRLPVRSEYILESIRKARGPLTEVKDS